MKTIVINATAARATGALTIIKDFMAYIYGVNIDYQLHLLTTTKGVFYNAENVFIHEFPLQNWKTRLLWDRSGFQKWCELNKLFPDVVVSFQNTCPRLIGSLKSVKLLVYYHQTLPLVKYPWKWYRPDERSLFLYAHFYGFFVNRWNKNAEYVVQLSSVKDLFCRRFPNIKKELVHVIRPNLPKIDINSVSNKQLYEGKKVFIYPATALRYKNHIIILKALEYIKKENTELLGKIKVIFTVPKNSFVAQSIQEMELNSIVDCIESVPYEDMLLYYKRSDVLLFPSKIESFGLPLIEAAMFGIQVIASDLPYAREVLENYDAVNFADCDDYKVWANAIQESCINTKKTLPLTQKNINTWKQFEQLMLFL